jgi:peroxiredoxin
MSLKQQLEQCSIDFTKEFPEQDRIFCRFIDELRDSGILEKVLKEGDTIPDFALPDIHGNIITLDSLLDAEKLIINFYRGGWCPYCSLELQMWESVYTELIRKNVNLVAISPEKAELSSMASRNSNLSFEVLSDFDNEVARQFGLVFKLDSQVSDLYESFGIDLVSVNGNDSGELPIPATYIVGRDRKIIDAYIDVDYRKRKDPEEILQIL